MDTLRQDLVYAVRRLRQSPTFTFVTIATLALGIGANSAIFSVVNAVLLRPLPFEGSDRLVQAAQTWKGKPTWFYSPCNYVDTAAIAQSFEGLVAIDKSGFTVSTGSGSQQVEGAEVDARFFELLRVRPIAGRGFSADENEPGKTKVAVLGYNVWRDQFGSDPGLIGRTVTLNREPHVVVGIAPAGFSYPESSGIWRPLEYDELFRTKNRGAWYLTVIGRLKPGVTLESAREELNAIAARLREQYPDVNEGMGGTVASLHEATVGKVRAGLLLLLGAVGLVLLIACVNVANLLMARGAMRETEIALRKALGAGRGRLVRQLLTESLLLGLLGGAAGVALANLSLNTLLALQPEGVPRLAEVRIDRAVLAYATLLSLVTGLLFGVFPSLQITGRATAQALREGSRSLLGGRGHRLRSGLVIGQIALAMTLLAGAGLLLRSFVRLRAVDPGFRTENALTFRISLPESAYEEDAQLTTFHDQLLTRLQALPGVRSVGEVSGLPLGGQFNIAFEVEGRPPLPPAQQPSMETRLASAGYFDTMGIRVVRGRGIEERDVAGARQVVVLTEAAVRRYFPDEDPIGKVLKIGLGRGPGKPKAGGEVVGIVADIKDLGLAREHPPEVYIPYRQFPFHSMSVVMRTVVPPRSIVPSVEGVVRGLDREVPLARVATLDEVVARSISGPRFYMLLLGCFAATALFLAGMGIFGVMSYAVTQRSREIGIRVALGAHPRDVLGMVLGHALLLSIAGVGGGLLCAVALSRVISGLLFALSPTDPSTLLGVAALLMSVALVASYLPARRAMRVDPVEALRTE
jgi:putative ABC transport system permease protein